MNVIETLQDQMEEEKAKETEDGQSVNSSENADSESTEMEVQEDADSMDETPDTVAENKENCDVNAEIPKEDKKDKPSNTKAVLVSKRRKLSKDGGKAGDSGGTEDHETAKAGRHTDSVSTEMEVQADADSMDETPDIVAENKENCDVNAEIPKEDKTDKPLNATKARRVSNRKKPSNNGAKAGNSGGTEGREPAKVGRPKRACVQKNSGAS